MEPSTRYTALLGAGLLTLVLGVVLGWYGFPTIIDNMIEKEMVLTEDSESFDPWRAPTSEIDVFMQFIMFNVTNPAEVKRGDKPILKEVGPFSYKENRQRINLTWSEDGTELTYYEVISYFYDQPSSSPDVSEDTIISTINAPMVVLAAMGDELPLGKSVLFGMINTYEKGESFKLYKAGELLMSGVDDPLMAAVAASPLSVLLPPTFSDGKFRLYGYNNTVDGPYTIKTGKDDINQFTRILSYQNASELSYWSTDYCNMLNGTDGISYPPNTGEVDRVYIFNKDLCRSIYLDYEKDVEYFGIPGRRFAPTRDVLEDPAINEDNQCYCVGKCLKAGVMSLSPCQYGAPIVASTPHFYMGAEEYINQSIGLSPDKNRHQTFIDIEPYTGLAMNGGKKIQINLQTKRYQGLIKVKGLEHIPEMLFPLIYTNETATIDQAHADELDSELMTPLKILTGTQWALIAVGALLVVVAAVMLVRSRSRVQTV
ncbi:sensory neuron membrane protein 2-like [Amphibalanus amphitrite]|uniref:sensory neuron membrane protein 2-like n=1 Tax=Amphibalanus amphitrite TaxID=1232801 RepID=UPI001C916128|nr:sensory neuron membrane protein 2-like [Amphibalanus amphitrite]